MGSRRRRKPGEPLAAGASDRDLALADRVRRSLRFIVVPYVLVGVIFHVQEMPLGRGPDETAHARYVEFLADNHRLPVFDPANPDPNYEFHQPPLYYVLCLPAYLSAGGDRDAALRAVRLFSLLLSLALVYLTFALGRALAPAHPWAPVAAAGALAFLPMHLSISTAIGNDVLGEICATAAVLILVLYLRAAARHGAGEIDRPPGIGGPVFVGIIVGLGMLTKSISVLLFPVAWLGAALAARHPKGYRWRQLARNVALMTGVALAISGWWLVRNQSLYGDPLAQKAFLAAFHGLRPSPESFMRDYNLPAVTDYVGLVVFWTVRSVTGVFGPKTGNRFVFFPSWVYHATLLLGVLAAVGFARYLRRTELAGWQRQAWALCAVLAALLLASFIRFNFSFFQAQARYLFPALPAAALAFSLGLQQLFPGSWGNRALLAAVAALALLSSAGMYYFILPEFALP